MDRVRCEICGTTEGKLCYDHDHASGLVRGVLCSAHNTAIGLFRDDPELLEKAIAYLRRPPSGLTYAEADRAASTEYMRRYRAENPEYWERQKAAHRAKREADPEWRAARNARVRARKLERYWADPEYRQRCKDEASRQKKAKRLREKSSPDQLPLDEMA
jgi:hypothetical protein